MGARRLNRGLKKESKYDKVKSKNDKAENKMKKGIKRRAMMTKNGKEQLKNDEKGEQ